MTHPPPSAEPEAPGRTGARRSPAQLVLILCGTAVAALLAARTTVHVCDGDAQLYRVIARNIVARGEWLDLTFLPSTLTRFREHLPFGVWPTAAAIAAFGEEALRALDPFWTVALLAAAAWTARRIRNTWAAAAVVGVLGTMEPLAIYASFPRLDGSTALFALLSIVPWLLGTPSRRGLLWSAAFAAIACAIKGPFGLVPLAATVLARAALTRSPRVLLTGTATGVAAALPTLAFLVFQREWGDATWWSGYVGAQLQSSMTGARRDGVLAPLYPFIAVGRHFWPGLAIVPFALLRAVRRTDLAPRVLGLAFLFGLAILCLPARKIAHHAVVIYPIGALFVAVTLGDALEHLLGRWRHASVARAALAGAAAVLWLLVLSGHPVWTRSARCLPTSDVGRSVAHLPPGSPVLLVSGRQQWATVSALAADASLVPWQVPAWKDAEAVPVRPTYAVVAEPSGEAPPPGWEKLADDDRYSVWRR